MPALIKGAENFRSTHSATRYINERSERNELNELRWERSVMIKVTGAHTDSPRSEKQRVCVKDRRYFPKAIADSPQGESERTSLHQDGTSPTHLHGRSSP